MKIERLSDKQIKFILTHDDLAERDLQASELILGSDKSLQFIREMMRQAMEEYAFNPSDAPLMVEAMPAGVDGAVVLVTKLTEIPDILQKLKLLPIMKAAAARLKQAEALQAEPASNDDGISIFSFDSLDELTDASARLRNRFTGISQVYKCEGRYFLYLQIETEAACAYEDDSDYSGENEDNNIMADMEAMLSEYGRKHISNAISRQYLVERGEVLIKDNAVEKLAYLL